ncbi:sulfotransferase [Thermococci archaeon]|nr:MAG: sulfotransferase [Thermococci archaeon]
MLRSMRCLIESLGSLINDSLNEKEAILIFGTPRGGTTWVMEILETLPEYKSIFEPFHKDWFPEVQKLKINPYRPYVYFEDLNPALKEYLTKVFKGEIVSKSPRYRLTLENIYKRILAKKAVVKFVRANRLLPWIANNFNVKGMFFVIRHPCATIASQLETGIRGHFMPKNTPIPKEIVLSSISEIRELRDNEELINKIKTIKTQAEILAAIWSIDNYLPLYYQRKFEWYTLVYESLVANPEKEIESMFSYINEEVPEKVYSKIRKPSTTTHDPRYLGTTKQLIKWKKKLSERQVKNILKVVHWFGLDFYTEDPEPDYDALRKWIP